MPDLFSYLLKANLALVLFFLAYHFLLRPLTFYSLNRFFLLFGIVFSAVYPLINLAGLLSKQEQLSAQLVTIMPNWQLNIARNPAPVPFDYWLLLTVIFWLGVALMGIRLMVQLISLYRIHRQSVTQKLDGYQYRKVNGAVNPFSFWQTIYINPRQHKPHELEPILKHEQVHVKQWHTLDVLLAELSTVFYWFNPGVWLIKRLVKENLEFITDRRLVQAGIDSKAYQYSLVNISKLSQRSSMANNFNLLTLKKRIIMMNKKQSPKAQISRYVFLLPLVIVLTLVFTVSKAQLEKAVNQPVVAKVTAAVTAEKVKPAIKEMRAMVDQKSAIETNIEPVLPVVSGTTGKQAMTGFNTADTLSASMYFIDGTKVSKEDSEKLNSADIWAVNVYEGESAVKIFGKEAANGVVVITTKENKDSEAVGKFNAKYGFTVKSSGTNHTISPPVIVNSNAAFSPPVIVDSHKTKNINVTGYNNENLNKNMAAGSANLDSGINVTDKNGPLYIVDGVEIEIKNNIEEKIDPKLIESIRVLNDDEAKKQYGEKSKNGVVLIYTKKK